MPFLSFSCLISVARISNTILNKSNRGSIFDLLLILKEKLSAFTIEYDINCGFFRYGLYCIDVCTLYTHFLESFIISGFEFCQMLLMFFILNFVNVIYYTYLHSLNHPCMLVYSGCMITLICC